MATDELDILADTTDDATGLEDTTSISEIEQAFPTADTGQYGDMIDASATFADANQYLGVNEAQWSAFVNEVNDIKAQMNAFEGNAARVMQDRSTPDALLDRRIAVLLHQNPGMTPDEARVQAETSPEYQDMVATNQQYEALNSRLNELYASVGLDSQGSITGSDMGVKGGIVRFDLQDGGVTFKALGNSMAKGLIIGAAAAIFTGPLATALGPASAGGSGIFSSAAAAKAASAAITSSASQLAATGELDIGQALVSAAVSYGGAQLGDAIKSSSAVGDIVSQAQSTTDAAVDFLSQGNSLAEAAIRAGGMSMLTQLVTTGEVDMTQAAIAAVISGGAEAVQQLATASGQPVDEFMADLQEQDEFVQAAIDADIKDPFLNPNYTTVGDGVMINAAGDVFNYAGDNLGNMSTLDTNNDGQLSGIDLEEITTPDRTFVDPVRGLGWELGDDVIVGPDGMALPKGSVLKATRDGGYYSYDEEGNKINVTLKPYNEVFGGDKGNLVWTSEGGTDGYISYENGELAYKKVEGQWVDAQGNVVDDPQTVDELTMVAAKAIDEPLESVTYFDQSGTAINYKYPPAGLKDNFVQGQFAGLIFGPNGEISEVWYDPQTNTEYVRAQGTTEITAIRTPDTPPETIEIETTTTDTTQATTAGKDGGVEVASTAAENVAGASTSQEVSTAINNAVNQGASSSALSAAINAALLAGTITPEQAAAAYDSIGTIDITPTPDGVPVDAGSEVAVDTTTGGGLLTGGVTTGGVDTSVSTTTGVDAGTVTGTTSGGVTGGEVAGGTTTGGEATTGGTATTDTSGTGGSDVVDAGVVGTVVAGTVTGSEDPSAGTPGTDGTDGTGSGGGDDEDIEGRRTAASGSNYERYDWQGLTYTTPTIQEIIQNPNVDYMASLNNVINQGMFGKYI
jgi:hypothetical protein